MANVFLAWQNRTDEGSLSGGSWAASLPLSNLQNRQVQKVARSSDAALASTRFVIDLGQSRSIGVLALVVHNMSVTSRVRITASDTANGVTNLLSNGSPLNLSAWSLSQASVSADAAAGVSGATTADKLIAAATTAQHYAYTSVAKAASPKAYSYTVRAKPSGYNSFMLELDDGTSNGCYAVVNAATGAVVVAPTMFGTGWSSASIAVSMGSDGWCKATLSVTSNSTATVRAFVGCALDNGAQNLTGNGTDGVLFDSIELSDGVTYYDSGWVSVWPSGMIPQSLLEWEEDNFWLGTLSAQARAGYQSPFIHILPNAINMRYWEVEVADPSNSDGYVQIGRLFMAQGWRPGINYAYGAELGYDDPTPVDVSLSGAEFFDIRSRYRVFRFQLQYISESDAYSYALDMQRLAGISGEVLLVPDSDDQARMPIRSYVGRLRQLGRVSQPQPTAFSADFEIKELL